MTFDIIFLVNAIAVFLLVFFSVFLLTRNGGKRLSNLLLAGFLLINAVPFIFDMLSTLNIQMFRGRPTFYLSFFVLDFLMGPLLYFYTRAMTSADFRLRKKHGIHLIPATVFVFFLLASSVLRLNEMGRSFIRLEITIVLLTSHILLVTYAVLSVKTLRRFRASIRDFYSYMEKISLAWLRFVLIGFGTVWSLVIVNYLVRLIWKTPIPGFRAIIPVLNLAVTVVILFHGMAKPKLFSGQDSRSKYLKSTLTPEKAKKYKARLENLMRTEKPHLTPSLTIDHLSRQLAIPAKHLSQVLNEAFQQNFFDFINRYRVEEAKQVLTQDRRGNLNFSQILYDVGFNSKAAFNRAFARHTGMSPRAFKKQAGSHFDIIS